MEQGGMIKNDLEFEELSSKKKNLYLSIIGIFIVFYTISLFLPYKTIYYQFNGNTGPLYFNGWISSNISVLLVFSLYILSINFIRKNNLKCAYTSILSGFLIISITFILSGFDSISLRIDYHFGFYFNIFMTIFSFCLLLMIRKFRGIEIRQIPIKAKVGYILIISMFTFQICYRFIPFFNYPYIFYFSFNINLMGYLQIALSILIFQIYIYKLFKKVKKIRQSNIFYGKNKYIGLLLLLVYCTLILQLLIPSVTNYEKSNKFDILFNFGLNFELYSSGFYMFGLHYIQAIIGLFKLISIIIIRNVLVKYDSYSIDKLKKLLITSALLLIAGPLISFCLSNIPQNSFNNMIFNNNSTSIFYFPSFLVAIIILCLLNIQESKTIDEKNIFNQKLIKIICIASIVSVMIPSITIWGNFEIFFRFGFYISLNTFEITYFFDITTFSAAIFSFIPRIVLVILLLKFESLTKEKLKLLFKTSIALLITFPLITLFLNNILNPYSFYISFWIPSIDDYFYYIPWISAIFLGSIYNSKYKRKGDQYLNKENPIDDKMEENLTIHMVKKS